MPDPSLPTAAPAHILVGEVIAAARQRRGWTQLDLAKRLAGGHRHKGVVSRWERGFGISLANLLEVITILPEVGDQVAAMIRGAQRR
jgi:ribosome-binding protein aMBF1 (putative translation factor)